jgi:hypothetical protein
MVFLNMWKHGHGSCGDARTELDPQQYIESQLQTLFYGLSLLKPDPLEKKSP